jgi:microcystin-dependent protein
MALIAGVQYSGSPVGTIMSFSGASAPARTLLCNGDVIPNGSGTVQGITADFTALYAIIGSTYGTAGQLPDTRNVFLRGANASTRTIGSISYPAVPRGTTTNDKMQGHRHQRNTVNANEETLRVAAGVWGYQNTGGNTPVVTNSTGDASLADATNGTPRTGTETAPVNLGVNYCIAF